MIPQQIDPPAHDRTRALDPQIREVQPLPIVWG